MPMHLGGGFGLLVILDEVHKIMKHVHVKLAYWVIQ
jgi:hypothetical protein